ncbi:MAG: fibronectin type III domain-containing protein [Proteobacteria bacterium]|nr:fibronectin type III domain-containing protein [Pseudomonadota bacterium]
MAAVDKNNNVSQFTAEISITTPAQPPAPDTQKPTVPENVTLAAITYDSVRITWSVSVDQGGSNLKQYNIYRNGTRVQEVPATSLQFTDTGLSGDTTYRYTVSAQDGAGNESSQTTTASVTTFIETSTLTSAEFFSFKSPLPTGIHLGTELNQAFGQVGTPTDRAAIESNAGISTILANQFIGQSIGLGGSCSRNDDDCVKQPNNRYASNWNVIRMGLIINGCAQILEKPTAVQNALTRAGLTINSDANDDSVQKVYNLFFPEKIASSDVKTALKNVHAEAASKQLSKEDSWKLVILPVCESAAGGAF